MVVVREEQETQVVEEDEQPRLFVGMVETEKAAQSWTVDRIGNTWKTGLLQIGYWIPG